MNRIGRWAAVLPLFAAASAFAAEGDPPARVPKVLFDPAKCRALAERVLEEARGEASRKLYRLVLPAEDPAPPERDCEVVLIGGYISNHVVVFRWNGVAVEVRRLGMSRTWFYNDKGESFRSRYLCVDAREFSRCWGAALLMIGARTERRGPPPDPGREITSTFVAGSHTPEAWIRVRTPGGSTPLFLDNRKGSSLDDENVCDFDEVRAQALHRLFYGLVDPASRGRAPSGADGPVVLEHWRPFLRENLGRFLESPAERGKEILLVEQCLRALAEAGDDTDRSLLEKVDERLAAGLAGPEKGDYGFECAREEAAYSRTRLRLRWEWDAKEAARAIHENSRERHAQNDLARWIRDRYHEKDPKGYREMLLADLRSTERLLVLETIREVGRRLPAEARALLEPFRTKDDEQIREAVEEALAPPKASPE